MEIRIIVHVTNEQGCDIAYLFQMSLDFPILNTIEVL